MEKDPDYATQLTVRIPKALRRKLRLHCVEKDVSLMRFVVEAVAEKLKRDTGRPRPRRSA